jgi:UDP-glucose 4-epimerase
MESDKKFLITGGSGFIGQHLAKKFIESGHDVCIFDIAEPSWGELKEAYTMGDIFNQEKINDAVKDHEVVIHLVGLADSAIAQGNPAESFRINIMSLHNVLEACRKFGDKKLIFPSSAAVYGITEDLPVKESFPPKPTNMYSWHKYLCEKLIKAYHDNYGIDYVILRLFNVYGAGHKGVIEIFLNKSKKGEVINSFGPYQYRDFVYAGDVATAAYQAAIYTKVNNRVVNIGSGRGVQIREVLDLICKMFPNAKWVETKAKFTMYDSIADITLAKILLDFKPHDTLEFMKEVIKKEMM